MCDVFNYNKILQLCETEINVRAVGLTASEKEIILFTAKVAS